MPDAAGRHSVVAGTFTRLVRGASDWEAPSPVAEWTAGDVVAHLVEWLPGFLAGGSDARLPDGPAVRDDPVGAWEVRVAGVQRLLEDRQVAASHFAHPYLPAQPLGEAVDRYYTTDVFLHSWDLARATGQPVELDAEHCTELLVGMTAMEQVLRESGQYGPPHPVADDAPVQDRLVAFLGRDPEWRPPR